MHPCSPEAFALALRGFNKEEGMAFVLCDVVLRTERSAVDKPTPTAGRLYKTFIGIKPL